MKYSKLVVFYFSGTGNAQKVAEWIVEKAQQQNIETQIFNIEKKVEINEISTSEKTLFGFCAPTHGFNFPPKMLNFISKIPKSTNNYAFIINTRAGMKLWKFFTPGLSGGAQIIPAAMLRAKGLQIVGYQPMDMPSNWISIHPGIREKIVISIQNRCKRITEKFTENILSGKKIYKGLISLPIDLAILPITFLYYFIGRFMLAKTFVASYKCNNCGLCEKNCPVSAIKNSKKHPYWTFECESCMRCMNNCPKNAIETPHTYTIILWWLIFSIIPVFFLEKLTIFFEIPKQTIISEIIYWILYIISGFLFSYLGYKILYFLMRFKFFNYIITFTSLTKLPFWRRYKFNKKKTK